MIALIDYKVGNLQSVINAIQKVGGEIELVSEPDKLRRYDKAILPGVGAFGDAMSFLSRDGMNEAVIEFARSDKPLLGICLGMQLLFERSFEFGTHSGLGLIEGEVVKFDKAKMKEPLKIPHMGWNSLKIVRPNALLSGLNDGTYLYFVHSYHVQTPDIYVAATTKYGYDFTSCVRKGNIFGFQPHPEKSHESGLKIYKNFVEL